MYRYAYNRLLELRQNRNKREDPSTVSRWLLGALLLNPDVTTFWNMRRELVKNGRLEARCELSFVSIVLYYKAKCFEAFAYRRWLLQFLLMGNTSRNDTTNVEIILKNEVNVATMSADRYANNYHAWNHREYIVTKYHEYSPSGFSSFLESEWQSSAKWSSLHISDYSGFAYRQFLIKRLMTIVDDEIDNSLIIRAEKISKDILYKFIKTRSNEENAGIVIPPSDRTSPRQLLDYLHLGNKSESLEQRNDVNYIAVLSALSYWAEECLFNEELLDLYPGHESLWYHRRFLSHVLLVITESYANHTIYKAEMMDRKIPRSFSKVKNSAVNSPLESAFAIRNSYVIARARDVGGHQNVMGERFAKFLSTCGFVSS